MMNHDAEFTKLAGLRIERVVSWDAGHVHLRFEGGNELQITAGEQPLGLRLKWLPGGRLPVEGEIVEVFMRAQLDGLRTTEVPEWRELPVGFIADKATPVWFQALLPDGGNVQLMCYQEGQTWRRKPGATIPTAPAAPPLEATMVAVEGGVGIRYREPVPPTGSR